MDTPLTVGEQNALATSDTSVGTWTTNTGATTNLYTTIDEAVADDTDYVRSVANPQSAVYEVGLGSVIDPQASTGHVVSVRALVGAILGGTTTLRTEVRQGTAALTTPAFWDDTLTATVQQFDHTLSASQADAITDYSTLRLRFTATQATPTTSPTFVAAGAFANTATSGATFTPGLPAGAAQDDVLILVVNRKDTTTTLTAPTGWTQLTALSVNVGTTNRTEVWWRRMTTGFTAQALTFGSGTVLRSGQIFAIRGCPTGVSPFAQTAGADSVSVNTNTASSTTVNFTAVTPDASNGAYLGMLIASVSSGPTTLTAPAGWTTGVVNRSGNAGIAIGYTTQANMAGGTSTGVSTVTVGQAGVSAGVTLTFRSEPNNSQTRITWAQLQVPPRPSITREISGSAALSTPALTRSISASAGTSASLTRTVATSVPTLSVITRQVATGTALLGTSVRQTAATAALSRVSVRLTVTAAALSLAGQTRAIASSAPILATATRQIVSASAILVTLARQVSATASVEPPSLSSTRQVATSVAVSIVTFRQVSANTATSSTNQRIVASIFAVASTLSRQVTTTAPISLSGIYRVVNASVSIDLYNGKQVSATASLAIFLPHPKNTVARLNKPVKAHTISHLLRSRILRDTNEG